MRLTADKLSKISFLVILSMFSGCSHRTVIPESNAQPQCVSPVQEDFKKFISALKNPSTSKRLGLVAFGIPKEEEDFSKMKGMVLMQVRVYSQMKEDLPVYSVYFIEHSKSQKKPVIQNLPSIFPKFYVEEKLKEDELTISKARQDLYILVPSRFFLTPGEIGVRFKNDQSNLILTRTGEEVFGKHSLAPFLNKTKATHEGISDPTVVAGILNGSFCFMQE